jgi:hypothetical protein
MVRNSEAIYVENLIYIQGAASQLPSLYIECHMKKEVSLPHPVYIGKHYWKLFKDCIDGY